MAGARSDRKDMVVGVPVGVAGKKAGTKDADSTLDGRWGTIGEQLASTDVKGGSL